MVGAPVPAAVCRWGLYPRCPGVGRCLPGVYRSSSSVVVLVVLVLVAHEEERDTTDKRAARETVRLMTKLWLVTPRDTKPKKRETGLGVTYIHTYVYMYV